MDRYPYYKYTILLGAMRALAHIGIHFIHRVFGLSLDQLKRLGKTRSHHVVSTTSNIVVLCATKRLVHDLIVVNGVTFF